MFGFQSFSESPISALPLNKYQLVCSAGSYSMTGVAASFVRTKAISANSGTYAIDGKAANFIRGLKLNANAGSFALTGNDSTFSYNQVIYAGAFSFNITGNAANLVKNAKLNAESGAYTLTGYPANEIRTRIIHGNAKQYNITGHSADLIYTGHQPVVVETKGGIDKKKRTKIDIEREQREELEKIIKKEFDILDGTYVPEAVEVAKESVLPQINKIDYTEYAIALARVNELLLQAKIQAAEYEAELDDEESLLMLL